MAWAPLSIGPGAIAERGASGYGSNPSGGGASPTGGSGARPPGNGETHRAPRPEVDGEAAIGAG